MNGAGFSIAALAAKRIEKEEDLFNPNVVKVVFENRGRLFQPAPHPLRAGGGTAGLAATAYFLQTHRPLRLPARNAFKNRRALPHSAGHAESLEQLHWLENGLRIAVGVTEQDFGIDTPDTLKNQLLITASSTGCSNS